MKTLATLLVFVFALTFVGCKGNVKEVDESIKLNEDVIAEIGKKIEANPTEAGVEEARKVFESRKAELKAKSDASREAVNSGKVSGDQLKAVVDSGRTQKEMFETIRKKFGSNIAADQKFVALVNDFNALFK
jgi:hypothetical protein